MSQLVEALRYKPEGCGLDSRRCQWNFLLAYSFRLPYGAGVDSASNRNEYQEYFLGGKGKGGKSGSLNLLKTSGPVQACIGIALPF